MDALKTGEAKGRLEGQQEILKRQLQKRFGPLSDATLTRFYSVSTLELETLSENLMDAARLEDLFQ